MAREIALHGLGTTEGLYHRTPPNESWTQDEWERRILECIPGRVEAQCFALADAILALPALSSAPELLEVVRDLLDVAEMQTTLANTEHGRRERLFCPAPHRLRKARAAIAKATGEEV